ncbi:MAG: BCCT family transporter [Cobetia sp.]|mgnify:FL=1|uniref:BCCT family transporter n=1 Tax=Cobetia amphilecti TaxID=1055104 RepID=A0ABT6UK72_9GAMM|nr:MULTISPECIES: BCCT family transporter [Cobetia]AVV32923.1 BCCT family transporter [Halomonas sp. SF2003]TCJ25804.1 BCCT family transporter [Halomonas sp. GDM18]UTV87926.1 BCCT family transporter [Cobetia litoralis]KPM80511.1 glycine/betaine ABC transporter permease [Cobetia sp. UCD-24C]MBF09420.1 BCCT family transporter [Cobetia sp.]|tara:strand:- start:10002 stop:11633 length:1632 start_codon:yes stop_codon:yes gene_type:complete
MTSGGKRVFSASVIIILGLVALGAGFPTRFGELADQALGAVTSMFGWFYLISVFGFVIFLISLALSKYGKIRLGPQDSRPSYTFFSWVSMLLAAGFGVGLVFYGMAEPMQHYLKPPFADMPGETPESARYAIQYAFFNWGVHQWAAFSVVGLIIAYFQFRKGQAGLVSSVLSSVTAKHPKVRRYGPVLDVFAVVATVMGVATSLGLGVLQMNGGLHFVFGVEEGWQWQFIIMGVMFCAYMASTWSGLDKGIKRLSNLNMSICIALMLYVLFTGPTLDILKTITLGIGDYLQNFIGMSLRMSPYDGNDWNSSWTVFYWAWVIAWSPFVGTFVARVSRGRTIKEYVVGVLIVPPLLACLWIGVFGGAAINMELASDVGLAAATDANITSALFEMFDLMPFSSVLSVVAIMLIFIFLVTSADSASYIVAQMTDGGSINPPLYKRIAWGVLIAAICLTLISTGGLKGLQSASVLSALPFTFIIYGMIVVLVKELRADRRQMLSQLYRRHGETPVGADIFEADSLAEEDRIRRAPDVKNRRVNPRDHH